MKEKLTRGLAPKRFGPNVTDEQALRLGCRPQGFHVGVRYRDERVLKVAMKLTKLGLFKRRRGKRYGDGQIYRTTEKGREILREMNPNES